jgi:hypothetical protein
MEDFRGMHKGELAQMAELDDTEAAALGALGERVQWPVDQLPVEVDADVLRCLDVAGLIEAASVILVNQQKPGDKTPPAPTQGRWFSPIKQPEMAGGWDAIRSAPPLRAPDQSELPRVLPARKPAVRIIPTGVRRPAT